MVWFVYGNILKDSAVATIDKAKKIPSHSLVSFPVTDAGVSVRVMGDDSETARSIEQIALSK